MAEIPSPLSRLRAGTAFTFRFVAHITTQDGRVLPKRRPTRLAPRSSDQTRLHLPPRCSARDFRKSCDCFRRTPFARFPSRPAKNLGCHGAAQTLVCKLRSLHSFTAPSFPF